MKQYLDQNVYDAAVERLEFIFSNFEKVYFSFSAGKDSSVMTHLAIDVARRMDKLPVHCLFIDLEAQYKSTIEHATEVLTSDEVVPHWICLPLVLRNAVSQYQPRWVCWDKDQRDMWVRELPELPGVVNQDNCTWDWFYYGMEFEEFIVEFAREFSSGSPTAACIGIRADESMNRWRTIGSLKKQRFNGFGWTTQVKDAGENIYNAYPIYDWRVEDIWTSVGQHGWTYNHIYDHMYKAGRSIHDMRICQPYGDDQRKGLDLFQLCEPETWEKVVNRVSGANFGAIYKGGTILGNLKCELPDGHTWQSYSMFLLDHMPPALAEHYKRMIDVFLKWYEKYEGFEYGVIPDAPDPELKEKYRRTGGPSWYRIAKMLIKNDYHGKGLSFAQNKRNFEKFKAIQAKYHDI